MYRTILVPLDGSSFGERALPFATTLQQATRARLVLVRVVPALPSDGGTSLRGRRLRQAENYLMSMARRLAAQGTTADISVPHDRPAEGIRQEIGRRQADLVVMSTHGRSGPGRWVFGSVADEVVRRAEVPILLVPATGERTWPTDRKLRVLVPLDGSDLAEEAIGPAAVMAGALGADLLLLQVVEPVNVAFADAYPYLYPEFAPETQLAAARQYLEAVAIGSRDRGLVVDIRAELGTPISTIAEVARQASVDVIAMASHGRSGISRLVMGSVATGTVQRANAPILIVHPVAVRRAAAEPSLATPDSG